MGLPPSIPGAVSVLLTLVNQAYISIIAVLWYYAVHFGLTPRYAFPVSIGSNAGFMLFYRSLFGSVYMKIGDLLVLSASIVLVGSNSLGKVELPSYLLYRGIFAVALSVFSFQICMLILTLFRALFLKIWDAGSVNWISLFSVTGAVSQIKGSYHTNPFFDVMEFLLLSVYFTGTGALLAVLELRQALTIFLVLSLPLFSLFFILRGLDQWAVRFWKLFIEASALPFFILLILYNVHLFPNDFLLQAAFIVLAASSPYLVMTGGSVLASGASSMLTKGVFGSSSLSPAGLAGRVAQHSQVSGANSIFGHELNGIVRSLQVDNPGDPERSNGAGYRRYGGN